MNLLKDELYTNPDIYVATSDTHGWGVFTRKPLSQYDLIQEAPFVTFPACECEGADILYRYFHGTDVIEGHMHDTIIGFGFASLYNHSQANENVAYIVDVPNRCMRHYALCDIEAGEELFLNYGNDDDEDWGDYD